VQTPWDLIVVGAVLLSVLSVGAELFRRQRGAGQKQQP